MNRILLALPVSIAVLTVDHAQAQSSVEYSTSLPTVSIPTFAGAQLPLFDPDLGVLRSVEFKITGSVSGTFGLENTNATGMNAPPFEVGVDIGVPSITNLFANPAYEFFHFPPLPLSAYDGVTDFAGTSGLSRTFANETGTGQPAVTQIVSGDSLLDAWVGAPGGGSTLSFAISLSDGTSSLVPPGVVVTYTQTAVATVTVRYNYSPLPAPICRSSFTSGCPCGNFSLVGVGCANSTQPLGADLTVTGTASMSADTLNLLGSGMPNGPALYFQGTGYAHAALPLGDGLLCLNGTITRLGVVTNSSGASTFPTFPFPSVSVAGGVVTPGVRSYQVWYRDAAAFCTSATNNLSSGMAVRWVP